MKKAFCVVIAVIFLLICLCGCSVKKDGRTQVSLLISDENRIITMDYAEYLTGCILSAAEPSYSLQTLAAVGIACVGQAEWYMKNCTAERFGADLCGDSFFCPEWLSPEQAEEYFGKDYEKMRELAGNAAAIAAGICPYYSGEPAYTVFCKSSCGVTDDGGLGYLPSRELACDKNVMRTQCVLPADHVREMLHMLTGSVMLPPDYGEWFTDFVRTENGTLISVRFGGSRITGQELCRTLELSSTCIDITQADGSFTFKCSGCGNNCGMSVYAAERLARSGKDYEEILQYFYPGIELVRYRQ